MERNEPPRWMQDKHFNEVLFCEDFLAEYPMVCVDGSFFTVEGRVADEEGIRKQIYEMLRPHFTSGTARRATTLLETLRLEAYTPELPIQEDRIHVANGTLFLSGAFQAEKEFCRNRLPVNYDPSAPQPETWLRFLSDLLEAEDILTLQEYLGYCLIPTNRGQVMMLLKGNGGEGKSRIGMVMQKLLGSNLKNGSIAKVERSPFARADLEHELLMVDDDMKLEALKSTHYLKSLITAEMPMDLERKGEQSYQGQMYVRFLAFSNGDLESLYDHSDGFYRRQLILSVKKRPPNREDDPFLADKLCGEIEGIFLWCLEGLRRLQGSNFRFTESSQTKANREDARREANNVLLFLRSEGYIRLKADSAIPSAALRADGEHDAQKARRRVRPGARQSHPERPRQAGQRLLGHRGAGRAAGFMSSDTKFSIPSIPSIPKTPDGWDRCFQVYRRRRVQWEESIIRSCRCFTCTTAI